MKRPTAKHFGGCPQMLVDGRQRPLDDTSCISQPCTVRARCVQHPLRGVPHPQSVRAHSADTSETTRQLGRFRTARAQHQFLRCLSRGHPCKPLTCRSVHDLFKTASGVQNSGPWVLWLPVVENSRLCTQRTHRARCAPSMPDISSCAMGRGPPE